jgi:hypothetical protein
LAVDKRAGGRGRVAEDYAVVHHFQFTMDPGNLGIAKPGLHTQVLTAAELE